MTKVFLSAGHGGSDPGAVGNGLKEKEINLQIMLACRDYLQANGYTVVCSRVKDENDPVQEEVREANASGADVAVSFHTNAGGGDGSESFYYAGNNNGKRLAELCEKHIVAIGQNSRGVKTNNLMFTRATTMTAVLCECAFIDTKKDIEIVDENSEQKKFGEAYAKAIIEYFGGKVSGTTTNTSQSNTSSSLPKFATGINYVITASALKVRTGAGTNYAQKKKSQLTADGQKHANANGSLLKGTTITVSQTKNEGKRVWGKIPSGWVCLYENGDYYVKKK